MLTRSEMIVAALYREGPSPTAISLSVGLTIHDIRSEISRNPHLRHIYGERVAEVLSAIASYGSDISAIAKRLSVTRKVAKSYIFENPVCQDAYEDATGQFVDMAASNLRSALDRGERWATELVLLQSEGGREAGFGPSPKADPAIEAAKLGIDYQNLLTGITRLLTAPNEVSIEKESSETVNAEEQVVSIESA